MAKDKERSINPAQQQRKLEKAKALKKSKAELQTRRNEKLAKRNPDRLQRQIDDLKALEAAGDIKAREKAILEDLERDLKAVRKAREVLGEKAPQYSNKQGPPRRDGSNTNNSNNTVLGKRQHNGQRKTRQSSPGGSDTDESVRRIPMPEDTPPPIPREHRRYFARQDQDVGTTPGPKAETKSTYSAAPQIRDLKKEAVSKFVPNIVRQKQAAVSGAGGRLVEPEELDRLEAAGYSRTDHDRNVGSAGGEKNVEKGSTETHEKDVEMQDADAREARRLAEEEARFQRELDAVAADAAVEEQPPPPQNVPPRRRVEIEDVEDEDA